MSYLQNVLAETEAKYAYQPEFLQAAEEAFEKIPYLLAEHNDGAEHSGRMDHGGEKKIILSLHAQKDFSNLQMTAAADRQKFCKSLDQTEKHSLKPLHAIPPSSI